MDRGDVGQVQAGVRSLWARGGGHALFYFWNRRDQPGANILADADDARVVFDVRAREILGF